ncbi:MAG: restriction endonuclease subunit S [Clostridium perfringens]|nr:restriction endonuclease subunit S [Clostridium perfringens]
MKKEAREGYKMTELGEIPNDWSLLTIGDLFEFKNGLNKEKEYFGKGTKIINYTDVYKNRGLTNSNVNGLVEVSEKEITQFNTKKGDVFFTRTSETIDEIGMTAVLLEDIKDAVFSGFILRARPTRDVLDLNFKKYCFSSYSIRKEITRKSSYTTRALTSGTLLNDVKIVIPTINEQEKIAKILSTVDEQIENTEKLIQKNKELKKGLMQQLLTKGIGHTEFKKTEFGDIPDIWEIKKLSELANVIDSLHETPEYSEQGYPMIRVVDVNGKEINTKYTKFVSKDVFDKFTKKYIPRKNDIIMSRVGSYGQVSYLETDEKVCLGQNTVVITTDFDKKYIFYALSSNYVKNNIEKVTSGSSQKTLSLANIKDLKLLLPRIEEQNKIVAILSSIDEKIDKYQSKKIRLEEIKKGLMQQLLTGKIRVVL